MRAYSLGLLVGIAALSAVALGQMVTFCYLDDGNPPSEPPLTDMNGTPLPDGTLIRIMHDVGNPGPDPTDSVMASYPFNGDGIGIGTGYFYGELSVFNVGTIVYLAISGPGICWYTADYQVLPGVYQKCFEWVEWSQAVPPCPWSVPTSLVTFSYCIHPPWYWERPLGCPCESPLPDNFVMVMHDLNANGPDELDTALTTFTALDSVVDCIWVSPELTLPADFQIYLRIGEECCWRTGVYLITPPSMGIDLVWGNWICGSATCALITPEPGSSVLPDRIAITHVYPNPFNSSAQIELAVPIGGRVMVDIYNLSGQRVRTLLNNFQPAGVQHVTWNGRSDASQPVSSGVYLCRASSHGSAVVQKLLLLK